MDIIEALQPELTKTEKKVLEAVRQGYMARDIAQQFCVSEKAIKFHKTNLFKKYGVKSSKELRLMLGTLPQPRTDEAV